jgi:protein-disulfide isomerase
MVSVLAGLAAVVVALAVLRREFGSTPVAVVSVNSGPPTYVRDWRRSLAVSRIVGDSTAPVMIVEFSDLECPACRQFHVTLQAIRVRYGRKVASAFVHMPLRSHRFGVPAARAAECAFADGRFGEMVDAIYAGQDSLGLATWQDYARRAGVSDTTAFGRCVRSPEVPGMVQAGLAEGRRLNVSGTPTVIVNGWRFSKPPTESVLDDAIRRLLQGKGVSG